MLYELFCVPRRRHCFVHSLKYIVISILEDNPGGIDGKNVCTYDCTGKYYSGPVWGSDMLCLAHSINLAKFH